MTISNTELEQRLRKETEKTTGAKIEIVLASVLDNPEHIRATYLVHLKDKSYAVVKITEKTGRKFNIFSDKPSENILTESFKDNEKIIRAVKFFEKRKNSLLITTGIYPLGIVDL